MGSEMVTQTSGENALPTVSVGMPAYNNKSTISEAIDTILEQTFTDFELIISDNGSTDGTADICMSYAQGDDRIRFIQQDVNIGSERNFEFVYNQARGEFFMWAPAHYSRSLNFIEVNLEILEKNPRCAFSSSPNCFVGMEDRPEKLVSFSLEGSLYERISGFLDNCWVSHACYYSLFRRRALSDYTDIRSVYLANDWTLVLHLLSKGDFSRSKDSLLSVGFGSSTQPGFVSRSRTRPIHYALPLYEFSKRSIMLVARSDGLDWWERSHILLKLLRLNIPTSLRRTWKKIHRAVKRVSGDPRTGRKQ